MKAIPQTSSDGTLLMLGTQSSPPCGCSAVTQVPSSSVYWHASEDPGMRPLKTKLSLLLSRTVKL